MANRPSRMEVNAAIEKLIARSEDSRAAAQIVIQYGDGLRTSARFQVEASSSKTSRGPKVFGYSPGHGNVTIEDKEKEETQEFVFGVYKDRVGHYRLWKVGQGLLSFHHFWKSGLTTRGSSGSDPDVYRLGYDQQSLLFTFLGIERARIIFNLGFLQIHFRYLEPILGTIRDPRIGFSLIVS